MNKLVSKNSVLRFKHGKLILKFLNSGTLYYVGGMKATPLENNTYQLENGLRIKSNKVEKRNYVKKFNPKQTLALYLDENGRWFYEDGRYFSNTSPEVLIVAKNLSKSNKNSSKKPTLVKSVKTKQPTSNKIKSFDVGTSNPTTGEFTPNGSTYQTAREAVKSTVAELNPPTPEYMDTPGIYTIGTTLNSGNVRSNRNLYRNVDEYYDWLNTDVGTNSDDYKLFANTGLWAPNISEENRRAAFNEMMNKWGISGNLGRRDSGRLANLLNSLSLLGSDTKTREAFINSYNDKLDLSLKSNNSQFYKTQNFGLTTPQFITYTPSSDFTKNLTMLNADLKYNNMKFEKGGLISKNSVERFKNGGILKFLTAGSLPTAPKAEDRYKDSKKFSGHPLNYPSSFAMIFAPYSYPDKTMYLDLVIAKKTNNYPGTQNAYINRVINSNNDTIFTESPLYNTFTTFNHRIRHATNINKKGLEYDILKRRFNTAWNIAK